MKHPVGILLHPVIIIRRVDYAGDFYRSYYNGLPYCTRGDGGGFDA